jgi:hypothetical protein
VLERRARLPVRVAANEMPKAGYPDEEAEAIKTKGDEFEKVRKEANSPVAATST